FANRRWPDVGVNPPCVDARPCVFPTAGERASAARAVPTFVLTTASEVIGMNWKLLDPTYQLTNREHTFINGALALLRDNADLVRWSVRLSGRLSSLAFATGIAPPDLPVTSDRTPDPYPVGYSFDDVDGLADAVVDAFDGAALESTYVYVLHSFHEDPVVGEILVEPPFGPGDHASEYTGEERGPMRSATGGATDALRSVENGGIGPVIPLRHPTWIDRIDQMHEALHPSDGALEDPASALCAITELATVMIHEQVHVYTAETGRFRGYDRDGYSTDAASDSWSCWAPQKMAANTFRWAIRQRYECSRWPSTACPRRGDAKFLSSDWIT
ncbi:MAG: hypothetical protein ABMB14_11575, partial [Myxococcota bacterium]